jgi:hypothetical protein
LWPSGHHWPGAAALSRSSARVAGGEEKQKGDILGRVVLSMNRELVDVNGGLADDPFPLTPALSLG